MLNKITHFMKNNYVFQNKKKTKGVKRVTLFYMFINLLPICFCI